MSHSLRRMQSGYSFCFAIIWTIASRLEASFTWGFGGQYEKNREPWNKT